MNDLQYRATMIGVAGAAYAEACESYDDAERAVTFFGEPDPTGGRLLALWCQCELVEAVERRRLAEAGVRERGERLVRVLEKAQHPSTGAILAELGVTVEAEGGA